MREDYNELREYKTPEIPTLRQTLAQPETTTAIQPVPVTRQQLGASF